MARAGYALREKWAMERAALNPCPGCGHGLGEHREYRSTWTLSEDGTDQIEHKHPRYEVGLFHCEHETCDCERRF